MSSPHPVAWWCVEDGTQLRPCEGLASVRGKVGAAHLFGTVFATVGQGQTASGNTGLGMGATVEDGEKHSRLPLGLLGLCDAL